MTGQSLAEVIAKHPTTTLDGCWTRCACDGVWRGQQEWSEHVADAVAKASATTVSLHDRITFAIRDNCSLRVWAEADDIADALIDALQLTLDGGVIVGCAHD